MARLRRFERPTPAFGGQYSIQLSYRRSDMSIVRACIIARRGSKFGHPGLNQYLGLGFSPQRSCGERCAFTGLLNPGSEGA